ncbi:type VII secretion-associated protein [Corynebacterium sp. HMSC11E11]|uniref:type VII secretion-associated protein n=1 Tax=Corynebacterium sp. HMSC11E11 TaxID=1581089 RepID=UPI0008A525D5|nr:type VII secretion-associated protein [Corynebacterium sp. HMSC11E11]OFU54389.1 hypothetical protein HMPREF3121_07265 [Corynebacterium sp. HMSC11E11]
MAATTDRAPGPAVLHAWGPAACGPEGDAALIDGFGAVPQVVITPSYWGGRRRELFAGELVRRGADPRIGDLATELMGLERPAVGHSFLVEVEPGRICVSRLDFDAGLADGRLSFRGGDALEIIRDLVAELLADADGADGADGGDRVPDDGDVEFIVASGDDRLIADMRRRGWLAFPVPVELLGGALSRADAGAAAGRRHALHSDVERAGAEPAGAEPAVVEPSGTEEERRDGPDRELRHGTSGAMEPEARSGGLDIAALRRRARAQESARRRPRSRLHAAPAVAVGAVACLVAAAVIVLILDGPVGGALQDEAMVAAAADAGGGRGPDGVVDSGDSGPDNPPARPGSGGGSTVPDGPEVAAAHELEGKGVRVELPDRWRIDERATADALVLVDGGPMRILVTAGEVAWGMDADGLAAGLTAHAAGDPTMDRVRREAIEGLDVVVHEERPDAGSVVLWQHRLVDGWQVSVGCQFRGATIPQLRPVCGQALRTAAVVRAE